MRITNPFKGLFKRNSSGGDEGIYDVGFDGGGGLDPTGRNSKGFLEVYGKNSTFQMVARRVAYDVALVKWGLYKRLPGKSGPDGPPRDQVFDHEFLELWKCPNPLLVNFLFIYLVQLYLELQGECHIVIERPPGTLKPVGLWPVPKHWVAERPTPERPFWGINLGGGKTQKIPAGEVLWLHDPDPLEPYSRGLGVAPALDDDIQQDEWMNKFNNQFFRQGGHPGMVFSLEGIEQEQAERIKAKYERQYTGFWNAFKTAWIGGGTRGKVQVHQLHANHKDMDFNEGKRAKRDSILQAWNMQRFEVGINEDVNRASAQASADGKSRNVTLPRVTYLEQAFGAWLLPLYGDKTLMLIPENPVKQTEEFRLAKSSEGWVTGAITRDEWRKENGFDLLGGDLGNALYTPLNMTKEQVGGRRSMVLNELRELDPESARQMEERWNRNV